MSTAEYEVQNCPNCGNIFRKTTWSVCQDCKNEIENELKKCIEYIRRNRQTTMDQLIQYTGVNEQNIMKYIREGKINISDVPHLSYPCDLCQGPIRKANLCYNCRMKINTDIDKMKNQEEKDRQKRIQDSQVSFKIKDRFDR